MASRKLSVLTSARVTLPPGMMPQLISLTPNCASSAAIARSHATKGVNAPPKHQPFTMAMVGLQNAIMCRHCHIQAERRPASCCS